ncbi:MAG: hypothetical protein ABID64_04095 [Nitrospirota bacterium]
MSVRVGRKVFWSTMGSAGLIAIAGYRAQVAFGNDAITGLVMAGLGSLSLMGYAIVVALHDPERVVKKEQD